MADLSWQLHASIQEGLILDIPPDDPLAIALGEAIRGGDLQTLRRLLVENSGLPAARIRGRTLLHIATDWPGHFPRNLDTVQALIDAGCDLNAPYLGRHSERPLHWAASCDDVEVIDALLDRGADLEAAGGVIGNGTALADAVAFGQWNAARRLVQRGAQVNLWQAAALGLMDRVLELCKTNAPSQQELDNAFWCACHGGQLEPVKYLLERGANLNWVGHDSLTPLAAARRSGATELAAWLVEQGAT